MSEDVQVTQTSVLGSCTTQVGEQNNFIINAGITPEQAAEITSKLFMDNFPNLREAAMIEARHRAEELCKDFFGKLKKQDNVNYMAFAEPDVQFILNKAQQEYARFGTEQLRKLLSY